MKQIFASLSFIAAFFFMSSCKEKNYDGKTLVIQDSIGNLFPTYQAIHINAEGEHSVLTVVIGDKTFYSTPAEVKAQKAADLGKMILRIYGKDNNLEKGTLVVTKDVHNTVDNPKDGIATPIDFTALKKAMGN